MKGNKLGQIAVYAIYHMIGQTQECFQRGATMAEIASWLGVSKPTAKRFVEQHCDRVDISIVHWRMGHSVQYRYALQDYALEAYQRNAYKEAYRVYVGAMFGA